MCKHKVKHKVYDYGSAVMVQEGPNVRQFVIDSKDSKVAAAYNEAVQLLSDFRQQHKGFAHNYIAQFSDRKPESEVGTGGSDFMPALRGYVTATKQSLL